MPTGRQMEVKTRKIRGRAQGRSPAPPRRTEALRPAFVSDSSSGPFRQFKSKTSLTLPFVDRIGKRSRHHHVTGGRVSPASSCLFPPEVARAPTRCSHKRGVKKKARVYPVFPVPLALQGDLSFSLWKTSAKWSNQ